MNDTLESVRTFSQLFTTMFYDLGYADAVQGSGATSAVNVDDMRRALAYMKGYADACRLACPPHSRSWLAANAVGSMFAIIQCMIDAGDSSDMIAASLATYRNELALFLA